MPNLDSFYAERIKDVEATDEFLEFKQLIVLRNESLDRFDIRLRAFHAVSLLLSHTSNNPPMPPLISTDNTLLDLDTIHAFLSTCYWSPGIARERVERAINHSLCFGVYDSELPRASNPTLPTLIGFARVVTDHASFAYLCDVFILPTHRARGHSKLLMQHILQHPALQGLRRFCLMTRDAHTLYTQYGFTPMPDPTRYLERTDRESYKLP